VGAPVTQYARSGDLSIAYQVVGDGPVDLLMVPGFVSNVELAWDVPLFAHRLHELSRLGRLIVFDKRGTGCSDRTLGTGSSEDRMDDLRAVADAAGVERAVVVGASEGGPLAILFAAAFPERVQSLVLWGTYARVKVAPDYPIGIDPQIPDSFASFVQDRWGTGRALGVFANVDDDERLAVLARYERQTASPGIAGAILRHNADMDVRHALGAIGVPTLVVHHDRDPVVPVRHGRYLVEHIRNARMLELPGDFHIGSQPGDEDGVMDAIAEFVTGTPVVRHADVDRVLMTVLFTDIVGSTERAATMGDRAWRALLEQHDEAAAAVVERHRGTLVKRTGDGLLATFDGPGKGIRAAKELQDAVRPLGLALRAGVHTGEVERRPDDVAGIGVHIGARVSALAGAEEVLVTSTVKDLVMGSDLEFDEHDVHSLKGVPGEWQLWRAR
jgi:pimeloyl-ACP methyl ester carboxylesterase